MNFIIITIFDMNWQGGIVHKLTESATKVELKVNSQGFKII